MTPNTKYSLNPATNFFGAIFPPPKAFFAIFFNISSFSSSLKSFIFSINFMKSLESGESLNKVSFIWASFAWRSSPRDIGAARERSVRNGRYRCSPATYFPASCDSNGASYRRLIEFGEVADFDNPTWKTCYHFQLTAHGFNMAAQSGQIHVGSFFHFGDGRLLNMQHSSQHLLCIGGSAGLCRRCHAKPVSPLQAVPASSPATHPMSRGRRPTQGWTHHGR